MVGPLFTLVTTLYIALLLPVVFRYEHWYWTEIAMLVSMEPLMGFIVTAIVPIWVITMGLEFKTVMHIGLLLMAIITSMLGPSMFYGLPQYWTYTMIVIPFLGVGSALVTIPSMPEMMQAIESRYGQQPKAPTLVSGLFVTLTGLSRWLGIKFSTIMEYESSYLQVTSVMSAVLIVYFLIYFIMGGGIQGIKRSV